jgi:hypothetical protein
MNKPWIVRGGIAGTLSLAFVLGLVQSAGAQAAFPKFARSYIAYMARAMDQCIATSETVTGPVNLPPDGCPQTNFFTDNQLSMGYARVYLRETGRIIVIGDGFTPSPANVTLEMTLRVTREAVATDMGVQTVTFPDLTVQCPLITSQIDGSIHAILQLADCLGPSNSALASGSSNIEVVSVALLNGANGNKVLADPGIVR